jgi:hypothetical protein
LLVAAVEHAGFEEWARIWNEEVGKAHTAIAAAAAAAAAVVVVVFFFAMALQKNSCILRPLPVEGRTTNRLPDRTVPLRRESSKALIGYQVTSYNP